VSSYQSAGIRISPKIGALTNLDIDHLPWHGSIGQYHRDKLQLFCNSELENLIVPPWAKVRVSELVPLLDLRPFEFEIDNSERLLRRGNSIVELRGTALESAHMARNLAVACAVSEEALKTPLDPVIVNEVAKKFILPTGRLEVIPSRDSFTWVNDPLASNPFAASAAVTTYSAKPIVLILGGEDRGVDPSSLIDAIRVHGQVRAVVLLGPVGKSWASLISHKTGLRLFHVETMEQAVEVGASLAYSGDVILFSPAAPTPKHEGNWETRLKQFRDSVLRINKGLDD
jgi:UDP-N-acetylmuramoylalanine--D-glutamate ligase